MTIKEGYWDNAGKHHPSSATDGLREVLQQISDMEGGEGITDREFARRTLNLVHTTLAGIRNDALQGRPEPSEELTMRLVRSGMTLRTALYDLMRLYESKWSDEPPELVRARNTYADALAEEAAIHIARASSHSPDHRMMVAYIMDAIRAAAGPAPQLSEEQLTKIIFGPTGYDEAKTRFASDFWKANDAAKRVINFLKQPWQATHKHLKTGGLYRVIARAKLEADLTEAVIYEASPDHNNTVWVRPAAEFDDGRFEEIK